MLAQPAFELIQNEQFFLVYYSLLPASPEKSMKVYNLRLFKDILFDLQ